MKKTILIQCQSITYYYNALGAIYTKYPNEDIDIDVLITSNIFLCDKFLQKIKQSKYVRNVYAFDYKTFAKINKKIRKNKKTPLNTFLFNSLYKPQICKKIKNLLKNETYSDIIYSQETQYNLTAYLKFTYPEAHFIMYGDGSGILIGSNTKLDNPLDKPFDYKFFKEMKPDEVIALAPFMEDDSLDVNNIPISAINTSKLQNIIIGDENIQKDINNFTEQLLNKYSDYKNKVMLLMSQLDDEKYKMSQEEQIKLYSDIIENYCQDNSLVILKLHPTTRKDILSVLQQNCSKQYEFLFIPENLKEYPVEIYANLIKNLNSVITFLSSSSMSLSCLYGIKTIDAYDVIQKYPLKERVNSYLKVYNEVIKRLPNWDKKSLIYKCDLVPEIIKFYETDKNSTKTEQKSKLTFRQKLFSVTNINSAYSKKRQFVICGLKITV